MRIRALFTASLLSLAALGASACSDDDTATIDAPTRVFDAPTSATVDSPTATVDSPTATGDGGVSPDANVIVLP